MSIAHFGKCSPKAATHPFLFRPSNPRDRGEVGRLVESNPGLQVYDTLSSQVHDLIRIRHPDPRMTERDIKSLAEKHLGGARSRDYGVWVYYPWSRRLVHVVDEAEFIELRTNRNRYKITPEEQERLSTKRVGVIGLSVGQSVAVTLALERSCGELRLADPDSVAMTNLNRIRTGVHNLDLPKVVVTAREIAEIDPFLTVTIFDEGVTRENLDGYLSGGGKLDAVVDECDSLDMKCLLRERARGVGIPVVVETSDCGMLDIERFDLEPDRRPFHGLVGDLDPAQLHGLTTEQKVPFVLRILGSDRLSTRLRASMFEIDQTIEAWPQLASAVALGGGLGAEAVRRILLKQAAPSGRYRFDVEAALDPSSSYVPPQRCTWAPAAVLAPRPSKPAPPEAVCLDRDLVRRLVAQACLAPSGGNAQPWLWRWDDRSLSLFRDPGRSSGLIDFELGGSYVALGAAAESLRLASRSEGLETLVRPFPDSGSAVHTATFHFLDTPAAGVDEPWGEGLIDHLEARHTNRSLGDGRPLPQSALDALTAAVRSVAGADVLWLTDVERLESIGRLVGAGDRLRMLNRELHDEMFRELRWTRDEAEKTRDGVDVATLCLSEVELAGLQICSHWPALDLMRQWHLGQKLETLSKRFVQSSSAVGLILMRGTSPLDYFEGGRAVQRMWLTATEHHLAVHPTTALPYLFARLCRAGGAGLDPDTAQGLRALRRDYLRLFGARLAGAEVLLFRVSQSETEEPLRSLRRPVEQVLHFGPESVTAPSR